MHVVYIEEGKQANLFLFLLFFNFYYCFARNFNNLAIF